VVSNSRGYATLVLSVAVAKKADSVIQWFYWCEVPNGCTRTAKNNTSGIARWSCDHGAHGYSRREKHHMEFHILMVNYEFCCNFKNNVTLGMV